MTRSLWAILLILSASPGAFAGGASFTPVSLRIPVQEIGFVDRVSGLKGTLWQCSGWRHENTGCYVDFMNQQAVATLFQGALATLPATTYTVMYRNLCPGYAMPSMQVKGTVTLEGMTYYTASDEDNPLTVNPHEYGYAQIPVRACVDWTDLPRPVTVSDDERIAVDIIYFARDIAYVMEGSHVSGGMGGLDGIGRTNCKQGNRHALCINALDFFAFDGRLQEKVETYYIGPRSTSTRSAFAQMHLAFDHQDRFVGGVTQVFFEQGSEVPWPAAFGIPPGEMGKNPFFMPVLTFEPAQAEPGYVLRTASSEPVFNATKTSFVFFAHFVRSLHEGIFISPLIMQGAAEYRVFPRAEERSLP